MITKFTILLRKRDFPQCPFANRIVILILCFTIQSLTQAAYCQAGINNKVKDTLSPAPPALQSLYDNLVKEKSKNNSNTDELEIDGLIFDETRSKAGQQFYEDFFNKWEPPEGISGYSIFVKEIPFMMNMTSISIMVNDYEVLNTRLQPRGDFIIALVNDAVNMTREALLKIEDLQKQIEEGDQIGTGIY